MKSAGLGTAHRTVPGRRRQGWGFPDAAEGASARTTAGLGPLQQAQISITKQFVL